MEEGRHLAICVKHWKLLHVLLNITQNQR